MGSSGESPDPGEASTPAEFVAALRALRTWSGLTYRQLEGKGATYRDALPASTIATTLGRATLPRERFVDAFTRACGLGDDEVRRWLEVRQRLAVADPAPPPEEEPPPREPPLWRRLVPHTVAALAGVVIGVAGTLVIGAGQPTELPAKPVTGLNILAVGSWALIHPARDPELCVTEGQDRTGQYESAVAAQQPCAATTLPRVYLEPVATGVVQIQWHHPKFQIGCLTVMNTGPAVDLLEPRDDCVDGNPAQRFRLEKFGEFLRIRPEVTDQCLALRDQDTEVGTEIVQGRCSGAPDQDFEIELISPPVA